MGKKLTVVDRDSLRRVVAASVLRAAGWEVRVAEGDPPALPAVADPDEVLLIDERTFELCDHPSARCTAVVVVLGLDRSSAAAALARGAAGFVASAEVRRLPEVVTRSMELVAQLDAVRERCVATLEDRLAALSRSTRTGRSDPAGIEAARREAHSLRGVAGSVGLASVAAAAGQLETALGLAAPDWAAVDASLATLEHTVAEVLAEAAPSPARAG